MIGIILFNQANKISSGIYKLIQEPYCRKCSKPGTYTKKCAAHKNMYGFHRIYAMGIFRSAAGRENESDLLPLHIENLKNDKTFARPLGTALALTVRTLYPELLRADFLVPVPLHPEKFKKRKFNQAYELAKVLEQELRIPVLYAVIKTKELTTHSLSEKERKEATKRLYQLHCEKQQIENKYIIIIDDVLTTGSTVSAIAQLLLDCGARHIDVLVLARSVY